MTKDPLKHRVVSTSSEIIGEGAAIFTDMTEIILNTLINGWQCHLVYRNWKMYQ